MTDYEDEVVKFLATKENLKQALEIERLVPIVKQHLEFTFWKGLQQEVQGRIENNSINGWSAESYDPGGGLDKQWGGLWIRPNGESQSHYGPFIEKENRRLFYGIAFSTEIQPNLEDLNSLRKELQEKKFKAEPSQKNFLGWKWTDSWLESEQFYLDMADTPENFIRREADLLWELFKEHRQAIERINEKLAATVV